jgi:hypothetical protein
MSHEWEVITFAVRQCIEHWGVFAVGFACGVVTIYFVGLWKLSRSPLRESDL